MKKQIFIQTFDEFTNEKKKYSTSKNIKENVEYEEEDFTHQIFPELEFDNIAQKCLRIKTLKTRNSDSLDFHEVSVWSIKKALEEAYLLGKRDSLPSEPESENI